MESLKNKGTLHRDREESVFNVMKAIFSLNNISEIRNVTSEMEIDYKMLLQWMNENLYLHMQDPEELENAFEILSKADAIFGDVADIDIGNRAVHIDFLSPECNIDVVYLSQDEFDSEFEEIKNFKTIAPIQQSSIKLAKYALDKAGLKEIKGYQIEKACIQFNYNSLADYTLHNIKHFTGLIKKNGLTLDQVLRFLG